VPRSQLVFSLNLPPGKQENTHRNLRRSSSFSKLENAHWHRARWWQRQSKSNDGFRKACGGIHRNSSLWSKRLPGDTSASLPPSVPRSLGEGHSTDEPRLARWRKAIRPMNLLAQCCFYMPRLLLLYTLLYTFCCTLDGQKAITTWSKVGPRTGPLHRSHNLFFYYLQPLIPCPDKVPKCRGRTPLEL
jgi:hypothetical protein